MHPVHNLSAFVEYDEHGRECWTSIATDPTAPFRLASASAHQMALAFVACFKDTLNLISLVVVERFSPEMSFVNAIAAS
jgi:hypothetical protein